MDFDLPDGADDFDPDLFLFNVFDDPDLPIPVERHPIDRLVSSPSSFSEDAVNHPDKVWWAIETASRAHPEDIDVEELRGCLRQAVALGYTKEDPTMKKAMRKLIEADRLQPEDDDSQDAVIFSTRAGARRTDSRSRSASPSPKSSRKRGQRDDWLQSTPSSVDTARTRSSRSQSSPVKKLQMTEEHCDIITEEHDSFGSSYTHESFLRDGAQASQSPLKEVVPAAQEELSWSAKAHNIKIQKARKMLEEVVQASTRPTDIAILKGSIVQARHAGLEESDEIIIEANAKLRFLKEEARCRCARRMLKPVGKTASCVGLCTRRFVSRICSGLRVVCFQVRVVVFAFLSDMWKEFSSQRYALKFEGLRTFDRTEFVDVRIGDYDQTEFVEMLREQIVRMGRLSPEETDAMEIELESSEVVFLSAPWIPEVLRTVQRIPPEKLCIYGIQPRIEILPRYYSLNFEGASLTKIDRPTFKEKLLQMFEANGIIAEHGRGSLSEEAVKFELHEGYCMRLCGCMLPCCPSRRQPYIAVALYAQPEALRKVLRTDPADLCVEGCVPKAEVFATESALKYDGLRVSDYADFQECLRQQFREQGLTDYESRAVEIELGASEVVFMSSKSEESHTLPRMLRQMMRFFRRAPPLRKVQQIDPARLSYDGHKGEVDALTLYGKRVQRLRRRTCKKVWQIQETWIGVLTHCALSCMLCSFLVHLAMIAIFMRFGFPLSSPMDILDLDFANYLKADVHDQYLLDASNAASQMQAIKSSGRRRRTESEACRGWKFSDTESKCGRHLTGDPATGPPLQGRLGSDGLRHRRLAETPRDRQAYALKIFYKAVDEEKGVFTEEALEEIKHFEKSLTVSADYAATCRTMPNTVDTCVMADSISNIFYSAPAVSSVVNGTMNVCYDGSGGLASISGILEEFLTHEIEYWHDTSLTKENLSSQYTRALFYGGKGFPDSADDKRKRRGHLESLFQTFLKPLDDEQQQLVSRYKHITISWQEPELISIERWYYLSGDIELAILALGLVLIIILLNIRSCCPFCCGLVSILLAFSAAIFFQTCVFGISALTALDLVSLFLIAGLAADNIILLYNAYKQKMSALYGHQPSSKEDRQDALRECLKEIWPAMLATTASTCLSFYSNASSPISLVRGFGLFMGTLALWNLINVIMIFAPSIVWCDDRIFDRPIQSCVELALSTGPREVPFKASRRTLAGSCKIQRLSCMSLLFCLVLSGLAVCFAGTSFEITQQLDMWPEDINLGRRNIENDHFQTSRSQELDRSLEFFESSGEGCQANITSCPLGDSKDSFCSQQGDCDVRTGNCNCYAGRVGLGCSKEEKYGTLNLHFDSPMKAPSGTYRYVYVLSPMYDKVPSDVGAHIFDLTLQNEGDQPVDWALQWLAAPGWISVDPGDVATQGGVVPIRWFDRDDEYFPGTTNIRFNVSLANFPSNWRASTELNVISSTPGIESRRLAITSSVARPPSLNNLRVFPTGADEPANMNVLFDSRYGSSPGKEGLNLYKTSSHVVYQVSVPYEVDAVVVHTNPPDANTIANILVGSDELSINAEGVSNAIHLPAQWPRLLNITVLVVSSEIELTDTTYTLEVKRADPPWPTVLCGSLILNVSSCSALNNSDGRNYLANGIATAAGVDVGLLYNVDVSCLFFNSSGRAEVDYEIKLPPGHNIAGVKASLEYMMANPPVMVATLTRALRSGVIITAVTMTDILIDVPTTTVVTTTRTSTTSRTSSSLTASTTTLVTSTMTTFTRSTRTSITQTFTATRVSITPTTSSTQTATFSTTTFSTTVSTSTSITTMTRTSSTLTTQTSTVSSSSASRTLTSSTSIVTATRTNTNTIPKAIRMGAPVRRLQLPGTTTLTSASLTYVSSSIMTTSATITTTIHARPTTTTTSNIITSLTTTVSSTTISTLSSTTISITSATVTASTLSTSSGTTTTRITTTMSRTATNTLTSTSSKMTLTTTSMTHSTRTASTTSTVSTTASTFTSSSTTSTTITSPFPDGSDMIKGFFSIGLSNCSALDTSGGHRNLSRAILAMANSNIISPGESDLVELWEDKGIHVLVKVECDSHSSQGRLLSEALARVNYSILLLESSDENVKDMTRMIKYFVPLTEDSIKYHLVTWGQIEVSNVFTFTEPRAAPDDPCPGATPCSGHGACNRLLPSAFGMPSRYCTCDKTYSGESCSTRECPQCLEGTTCIQGDQSLSSIWACACPNNCSTGGDCDPFSGICSCYRGYKEKDCSVAPTKRVPLVSCIEVSLVWGLKGYTPQNKTNPDYDDHFDFFDPRVQEFIQDTCKDAMFLRGELAVREEQPCWIDVYGKYVDTVGGAFPVMNRSDGSVALQSFMHFRNWWNEEQFQEVLTREDRIMLPSFKSDVETGGLHFAGRVRYLRLRLRSNMVVTDSDRKSLRKQWENFVAERNKVAPHAAGKMLLVGETWAKMSLEEDISNGVVIGLSVSLGGCLIVVIIFLRSFTLTILVVFNIMCVVCVVAGFLLGVQGYAFGPVEMISSTMLVGMGVDYALHLAHGYKEHKENSNRIEHAVKKYTVSILGGAMTTAIGVFVLTQCKMILFQKLGWALSSNAFFSAAYTFLFLAPMLRLRDGSTVEDKTFEQAGATDASWSC